MELWSPATFLYTFLTSPLSDNPQPYSTRQLVLAGAYLIHYLNRAIISPYRSPSRSKSHIAVPLAAISFNLTNGFLMGSYLSSTTAQDFLESSKSGWMFSIGMTLWTVGFIGNLVHDEILYNIRRNQSKKGKEPAEGENKNTTKNKKPHYAVPHGLLYEYVSFPNYFCEWVEWIGFALASAGLPPPFGGDILTWHNPVAKYLPSLSSEWMEMPALQAPWAFVVNEVLVMFPRAFRGHQWYQKTFGDGFPKERRIVIPWIL